MRTAVILGATGLVGKALMKQLLEDSDFSQVKVLVRRSTGIIHAKLKEIVINFDEPEEWAHEVIGDVLFAAFGTTLKKAGGKEAQYKVDYSYQFLVARLAAINSVPDCILVSSAGASIDSKFFYSRMKAELDRDVAKLDFDRLVIMKPSMLIGEREDSRMGETVGSIIMKALFWIPGIRKYRPIPGTIVAQAMIHAYKNPGVHPITQYSLDTLFDMN